MNFWKKLQHVFQNQVFSSSGNSFILADEHSPPTHSHINCTPTQVALKSMNFQQNMNGILNFFPNEYEYQ